VQTRDFFKPDNFEAFRKLNDGLKTVPYIEDVLSLSNAVSLAKDTVSQKLVAIPVFPKDIHTQAQIDSSRKKLDSLPFYRSLLYNQATDAYLLVVRINKDILNSKGRTKVINDIIDHTNQYTATTKIPTHISGLPLIRTQVADRIASEMKWFIIGSLVLSALILLLMFRSIKTALLSLLVVIISVIWSFGILYLFGYKITLLTALIPPLIVVIGIPNCIYFLNKYHSSVKKLGDKEQS